MYQICGFEKVDYVSKKTGRAVTGHRVYLLSRDDKVNGFKTSNVFVSDEVYYKFFDIPLDSFVDIYFNAYGNVVACKVINN